MTTTAHPSTPVRPAPDPLRRTARAAGILYLLTFVSMPTIALSSASRNIALHSTINVAQRRPPQPFVSSGSCAAALVSWDVVMPSPLQSI